MREGEQIGPKPFGGDRGGATYQPLDPRDLLRFPALDDGCLAIRGMLRDYADGDLESDDRDRVDEHVHSCRDCSLALSRAELEVMRISKALTELRQDAADVPPGLSGRVLAAVGRAVVAEPETPPDFTSAVMDRVRREWRRESIWERSRRRLGRAPLWATAAAAALVLFLLVGRAMWSAPAAQGFGIEVAVADDMDWIDREDVVHAARPGQLLLPGTRIRTGARGGAVLVLRDLQAEAAAGDAPDAPGSAARLLVDAGTELRFDAEGRVTLIGGAADLQVRHAMVMELVGLGELALGSGEFGLSIDQVQRFDGGLGSAVLPRARVEVLRGELRLRRGADRELRLSGGEVARFDAVSAVDIEPALSDRMLAKSWERGLEIVVPPKLPGADEVRAYADSWSGRVVSAADGRGVSDAQIRVVVEGSERLVYSGASGQFNVSLKLRADAEVSVQVIPPQGSGLAAFGPLPRPVRAMGSRLELAPVALQADFPVQGRLLSGGVAVASARVVPCLVDEAFGLVERIEELAVESNADGQFELEGLPAGLAVHQLLVLLVEDPRLPTTASLQLGRRLDPVAESEVTIEVSAGRRAVISGLHAEAQYVILREIPGLALTVAADVAYRGSDSSGQVVVEDVGVGRLWLADGDKIFATQANAKGDLVVDPELSIAYADYLRMSRVEGPLDFLGAPVEVYRRGHRFLAMSSLRDEEQSSYLSVYDPSRAVSPSAMVFALTGNELPRFAGATAGGSMVELSEDLVESFRLLALARDGSLGLLDSTESDRGYLALARPGRVSLAGDRVDHQLVAFDALDGVLAGRTFWRVADAEGGIGSLPAGEYRVRAVDGRTARCEVQVDEACVVELR